MVKRILAVLLLLISIPLFAQQSGVDHVDFDPHPVPIAPGKVSLRVFGNLGSTTCTYWVSAVYKGSNPIQGETPPTGPTATKQCPDTLSASNYVRVSWQAVDGAQSYNVFKTATAPATGSILLGNVTANFLDDTGQALSAWTKPTGGYPPAVVRLAAKDGVLQLPPGSSGSGQTCNNCTLNNPTINNAIVNTTDITNITVHGNKNGLVGHVNPVGDGTFFPTAIPNNTDTSGVETINFNPNNAPANTVWAGPSGTPGTNVSIGNISYCTSTTTTYTCPFAVAAAGDFLIITATAAYTSNGLGYSTSRSDTLSSTWTHYGGNGSNAYDIGLTTASGADVISVTSNYNNATLAIIEVSGASAFLSANSSNNNNVNTGGAAINFTQSISAGSTTDGVVEILNVNHSCSDPATFGASPIGVTAGTWSYASGGRGAVWLNAPGTTSAVSYTLTAPANGCSQWYVPMFLVFAQSASSSSGPASYRNAATLFQSIAARAVLSSQTFTIAAAVNLPSATNTTVLTGAVTMPSSGCPCRALVQSGIFLNSTTSAQWGWWLSDGTNTFGYGASITTDAHTPPVSISNLSPVSYSNGQTVTFSVIINPGTYGAGTVQALSTLSPPLPASAKSWMAVSVMPSVN